MLQYLYMKKPTRFIIDVVPLVRISFSQDRAFSYYFSQSLPLGSLVEIPLGKSRIVQGIVIRNSSKIAEVPLKTLKPLHSVLFLSLLTLKHIKLAQFISKEYFVPTGIALKLFIPLDFKKRTFSKITRDFSTKTIQLTPHQKKSAHSLLNSKKTILLEGPPSSGKTEVLINVAQHFLKQKRQVLFLLPEIALTPHTINRLILRLGQKSVLVFHSGLSIRDRMRVWGEVSSGTSCIIIGSRSSLFLPFKKLSCVIVDEEHDDSHKQTLKSPRYDARSVAEKLASLFDAQCILASSTPRCETVFRAQAQSIAITSLPALPKTYASTQGPALEIIDMRLLHWKNKQKHIAPPIFSEELISQLREALTKKKQILLLVSRQGMNAFTLCMSCKNIFRCPKCERALVPQRSGHFLCLGGHFRTPAFPKCPTCGGLQFVGHGIGTQKVEEEVSRLFPYSNIARLDSQSFKNKAFRESIFHDMDQQKIDVLVGTQMIAKGWNLPHLSLIGIIDSDAFFSMPDYSSDIRNSQLFFQARGRLGRVGNTHPGKLLIQTYHAERPLFSYLEKNDYFGLLKDEMETRESLKYPPYCRLLRLVGKNKNDTLLRAQALELYKKISHDSENASVIVSRPAKSLQRQKPGEFSRNIVLKYFDASLPPHIRTALENIPKNWYIDNDALSLS